MSIALKIDVDTLRGTQLGVPRLVEALRRVGAGATFLFSLGPDHTGRIIKRMIRPDLPGRVGGSPLLEYYGLRALLYGTLLPGPDIGRQAQAQIRAVRDAGFEVGVHCWDHVAWQDHVARANAAWTLASMQRAIERFIEIFGEPPRVHGAARWQMNREALRLTQRLGFDYASDCRGTHPFLPLWQAEPIHCPQFPTTLPMLDELIGRDGRDAAAATEAILDLTAESPDTDQVFTLHAEREGLKLLPFFERLLQGWKSEGRRILPLRALFERRVPTELPRHEINFAEVAGCSGKVLVQGAEFLAKTATVMANEFSGSCFEAPASLKKELP